MLRSPSLLGWSLLNCCVTNDHGYVPLVVSTSRSFPHSRLITGFVTRLTRRVPLVEQELLTLPEHLNSSPVFSRVRVTRSLVLYVCFVLFFVAIVLSVLLWYTVLIAPFVRLLSLNNLIWLTITIMSPQYKFSRSYSFSVHNSESKILSKTLVILELVPKGSAKTLPVRKVPPKTTSSARHLPIYKSHLWT
jgi:hypothetical protein